MFAKKKFTRDVAEALNARELNLEFEVKGALELRARTEDGDHFQVNLDRFFRAVKLGSRTVDCVVEELAEALVQIHENSNGEQDRVIQTGRLIPVIKPMEWISCSGSHDGAEEDNVPVHLPLTNELGITFAEEGDRVVRFLIQKDLPAIDLSAESCLALSLENFKSQLENIEVAGGPHVFLVSGGHSYNSSLVLLSDFWKRVQLPLAGEFVVAIPASDVLIVTGTEEPDGVEAITEMIQIALSDTAHPLSDRLFLMRNGKLVEFEG